MSENVEAADSILRFAICQRGLPERETVRRAAGGRGGASLNFEETVAHLLGTLNSLRHLTAIT